MTNALEMWLWLLAQSMLVFRASSEKDELIKSDSMSVRPSTFSSELAKSWYVGGGRCVMDESKCFSYIQDQGQSNAGSEIRRGPKAVKYGHTLDRQAWTSGNGAGIFDFVGGVTPNLGHSAKSAKCKIYFLGATSNGLSNADEY